ncbi:MAG: MobQ family relaxase, partial [Patescibacteria group bacterium]
MIDIFSADVKLVMEVYKKTSKQRQEHGYANPFGFCRVRGFPLNPLPTKTPMAIYRCEVKTFTRSKGQSSTAAASYRAGIKLKDETTGITHNYTRKKGVDFSAIIVPENAPAWAREPTQLWNNVEKAETRKNSTVAREFLIALPKELNQEQRYELSQELTQNLVDRFGFAAQYSIHLPDRPGGYNHHVHILTSTRQLEPEGFTKKTRELDDRKTGAVEEVRKMVADTTNEHLARAGLNISVSHLSLQDQQTRAANAGDIKKYSEVNRLPTVKVGYGPQAPRLLDLNHNINKTNSG